MSVEPLFSLLKVILPPVLFTKIINLPIEPPLIPVIAIPDVPVIIKKAFEPIL